jgi:hypothetical protein
VIYSNTVFFITTAFAASPLATTFAASPLASTATATSTFTASIYTILYRI